MANQKTILITGAARGIGRAVAVGLLRAGHRVIAVSRNAEKLNELKDIAGAEGASIYILTADLTQQLPEVVQAVKEITGRVDVLINNAGLLVNKPIHDTTDEDIHRVMDTNFTVPVRLVRDLLPLIPPGGHIINIGSMGGYQGSAKFPGLSIYSSSKAALAVFSECMAEELKEKGVAVNCLALGSVDTEMLNLAFPDYQSPTTPEEMGEWIMHFALEGNRWFNGKVLPVSIMTP